MNTIESKNVESKRLNVEDKMEKTLKCREFEGDWKKKSLKNGWYRLV